MSERPFDVIVERLDGVLRTAKDRHVRAICPAHESKHRSRSLTVSERPDGKASLLCFAGCDYLDVLAAINLRASDLYPRDGHYDPQQRRHGRPSIDWRAMFMLARQEILVGRLIVADIANGRFVTERDGARLDIAYRRLTRLWEHADGR